ncbi:hypothetical protein AAHE18_02G174900 [Arachis hypogaea]
MPSCCIFLNWWLGWSCSYHHWEWPRIIIDCCCSEGIQVMQIFGGEHEICAANIQPVF